METDYQTRYEELVKAVENFYEVKGRHNLQIAAAKLFELVGLPTQYPENYKNERRSSLSNETKNI